MELAVKETGNGVPHLFLIAFPLSPSEEKLV